VNEIIVVDACSVDRTIEIAKEFTSHIYSRSWDGYGAAKNYALSKCTNDWILWLDADERVTPELREEINKALVSVNPNVAAFSVPRRANFLGRWIKHCGWYPGRITRIFKRSMGKFTEEKIHERLEVNGDTIALHEDLLHYTDPELEHYYDKFNKYTSLAAKELIIKNTRFNILELIINPAWVFIRMYILKLGFLDGIPGLILCVLSAHYVFAKYAKLWEHSLQVKGAK
jgi:glycosyltransferase involved in cell wall biosynthesis